MHRQLSLREKGGSLGRCEEDGGGRVHEGVRRRNLEFSINREKTQTQIQRTGAVQQRQQIRSEPVDLDGAVVDRYQRGYDPSAFSGAL